MKVKSKPLSSNSCKIITKPPTSSTLKKPSLPNVPKQTPINKTSQRKPRGGEKQNIESSNIPSPEQNLKNKNFKPKLKKGTKLQMQSTISLVINQSTSSLKKHDLLDSLLYGDIDLTYSQDLNLKEEEGEELLIGGCDQALHPVNFKHCKNLSPIKSISEYSVTQNENQIFVVQKTQNRSANATLKLRYHRLSPTTQKRSMEDCVLFRRLLLHFNQKNQSLFKFYSAIHQSIAKQDLFFKIRQYLFKNGIVFKKAELSELIQQLSKVILQENRGLKKQEFCEENLEIMMEKVFLTANSEGHELNCNLWIVEDIHQRLFDEKDLVSVWKLIVELCSQVPKEIQASFRQSRFCLSMDSTQFFHETDQKRKKDNISTVLKWLSQFIRTLGSPSSTVKQQEEKITIKISPPPGS